MSLVLLITSVSFVLEVFEEVKSTESIRLVESQVLPLNILRMLICWRLEKKLFIGLSFSLTYAPWSCINYMLTETLF